jgi:DNA-binding IclR family transcriptional regulator
MAVSPPTSRVIAVLETLADSPEGLAASSMARTLGLSTSTLSLILMTLREMNYVERLPDRSFRLGAGVMRLFNGLKERFPLIGVGNDEINRLFELFGCGCALARIGPYSQEVVLTAGQTADLGIHPGVRLPLDPPHGAIAMAWRSAQEIDQWLLDTPYANNDEGTTDQRDVLASIRDLGFVVYGIHQSGISMIDQFRDLLRAVQQADSTDSLQRRLDQLALFVGTKIYTADELASRRRRDVSHIIAPVFGVDEQPRYLVSLHVMRDSISPDDLQQCIDQLLRSTEVLSAHIGGRRPT